MGQSAERLAKRLGLTREAFGADGLYAEAIAQPGTPPQTWRDRGLALKSGGDKNGAVTALRRYLELDPQAQDRAFVERYLQELEANP